MASCFNWMLPSNTTWPNHALQRTAPCVTAPASAAAFPPTVQVPRRTPRSLSLGSLGVRRTCLMKLRHTLADSTATGRAGDHAGLAGRPAPRRSCPDHGRLLPGLLCERPGRSGRRSRFCERRCSYTAPLHRHARSARHGPWLLRACSGAAPSIRCSEPLRASQPMLSRHLRPLTAFAHAWPAPPSAVAELCR